MLLTRTYKVAEHRFSIALEEDSFLWELIKVPYGPFDVSGEESEDCIFTLTLSETFAAEGATLVYSNKATVEAGFVTMEVYRTPEGHYFELIHPGASQVNCRLLISDDFKTAKVSLHGGKMARWLIFNTAVDLCFLLAVSAYNTVLTHASSVIYQGRAYLFLGKSGTGKSTHSRMWLQALEDVVLMNDDHPVVRLDADGNPIAYGSPWSGKTSCYKNISAPLGGVIRISRAPYNKARRLSPIEAYASVMTSCSGMTWDKAQADGRDKTLQGIVKTTPCWVMECLPDEDAAKVCSKTVTDIWR